jgi:hypothetical protein
LTPISFLRSKTRGLHRSEASVTFLPDAERLPHANKFAATDLHLRGRKSQRS